IDAGDRKHIVSLKLDEAAAAAGQLKIISAALDVPCDEFNSFSDAVDWNAIGAELNN
ncbi:hypothetical protein HDU98_005905, partial [Podochytrium sp. JEL0797]